MMAPLALPNSEELLVETGPPTDSASFGLGSPQSAREIRARPIDIDKEIPLLFVDDSAANLLHAPQSITQSTHSSGGRETSGG